MGVYVKCMEMPKTCRECPLEQPYDGYNCAITGKSYSWALSDRPSDCPLVSVPPHGRLIDADKLKADNPRHMGADVPYVTEVTVEEIIDDAPTIIPADPAEEDE